ncbi:MAG: PspC domain-containing protein, partial [Solirubrobacteraceae bacterium]|nr:PspC domain-containing protein [Solirubrobacteraceae bacterium]
MPRSIQRSREDRVVAGVCGGVARAAGLDPTAVRVAAVVLAALGGLGLVAYVAAALVLPEEGGGEPLVRMAGGPRERAAAVAGAAVLVLAGIAAAAGDPWPWDRPGLVAAIAVLGGIAWLALRAPAPARAASASAPAPPSGAPPGAVRVRPTWADADPG